MRSPEEITQLTRGLVQGCDADFVRFHDLYYDRLRRYLWAFSHDSELTNEALQETYLRTARKARVFRDEAALWNWLCAIARNALRDLARKRQCYRNALERFSQESQEGAPLTPAPDSRQRDEEQLHAQLQRLPPLGRQVIEAKYLSNRTVRDIALSLEISEKAVESRLSRARQRLRTLFRQTDHAEP